MAKRPKLDSTAPRALCRIASEKKFQPELIRASPAGTQHRVGSGDVWRCASATESRTKHGRIVHSKSILPAKRIRKIRMVQNVKEFHAELNAKSFFELPILGH